MPGQDTLVSVQTRLLHADVVPAAQRGSPHLRCSPHGRGNSYRGVLLGVLQTRGEEHLVVEANDVSSVINQVLNRKQNILSVYMNKPGPAQVGAISKVQK